MNSITKKNKIFVNTFLSTTSIHGLTHLTGINKHYSERVIWIFAMFCCVYGASVLSISSWNRYQQNPTVISMERNWRDWNTSFPAITICPHKKYDERALREVIQNEFQNYEDKEYVRDFLIKLANSSYLTFKHIPPMSTNIVHPSRYMNLVQSISLKFKHILTHSSSDISNLVEMDTTITELGICYSYNSHVAVYNSYKYWKANNWTIATRKSLLEGNPLDGDMFGQVTNISSGYYVFIHSSSEAPDIAAQMLQATENTYKSIELTALSTCSTKKVKELNINQRKCRFMEESNLITSPVYSYRLCRKECRMKLSNELCNCIPYFYRPSEKYRICDVEGMHCLSKYSDMLIKMKTNSADIKIPCLCYPTCDGVTFLVETDENMEWTLGTNIKWTLAKFPKVRLKRDILFGLTDMLVSVGGTFGLFFGSSVLSFLEILYFFTIRLYIHTFY